MMTLIATSTVGAGGAASIDFTSIPGTMTDLMICVSGRFSVDANNLKITFNGVTTGYSRRHLYGTGSATGSANASDGYAGQSNGSNETANTFGNTCIYIPNYAGATNKSYSSDGVFENNATAAVQVILAGLWSNTAAISSLSLSTLSSGNFVEHSSATLYGITKGSSGGVTVSP